MGAKIVVSNGVGHLRYPIPPGKYNIEVIRTNGSNTDLYDDSAQGILVHAITLDPQNPIMQLYLDAEASAKVRIRKKIGGTVVELPSGEASKVTVYRTDVNDSVKEQPSNFNSDNTYVFENLPYLSEDTRGNGQEISFAIDESTLPPKYKLITKGPVTKKLVSSDADSNIFDFYVQEYITKIFTVGDLNAPISKDITKEGKGEYMGATGTVYIDF